MRDSGYDYRNLGLHITSLPTQPITIFVIGYTFGDTPRLTHVAHPYLEHQLCYIHIMVFLLTFHLLVNSVVRTIQQSQSHLLKIYHYLKIHSHTFILQSLLVRATIVDLSGTKIVSNHPLTVVGGHDCARIPTEYGDCDPISTQIPPTVNWGNGFLLPPLTSHTNGQRYKIIASKKNTKAEIKCGTNANETVVLSYDGDIHQFDTNSSEYCTVLTSNPSYVAEYGFGHDYLSDGYGDNTSNRSICTQCHILILCNHAQNYFSILVPNDQYFDQTYLYYNGFTLTPTWTTIY